MPAAFCVLNAYPKESRERFTKEGVGHPHDFFREIIQRRVPGAAVDHVFVADPDGSAPAGAAWTSYDGIVWTGSDLTVYDAGDPRVGRQIELAKEIFRQGVPSYGSCWGLQIAVVAAGGEVAKNPKGREWAFARAITPTPAGRASRFLAGKPGRYDAFIMHLDEVVRLPDGHEPLAGNAHCRVQAAVIQKDRGEFWAAQYHPEYNFHEMARLIAARAAPLVREGFFKGAEDVATFAEKLEALHRNPESELLRKKFEVDDSIVDPVIREREFANWLEYALE